MDCPVRERQVDRAKVGLAKGMRSKQTDAEALFWRRLRESQVDGRHSLLSLREEGQGG